MNSFVYLRVLRGLRFLILSLHRQQEWLLERFRDPAQEARRIGAVDQAMIVGKRKRQHSAAARICRSSTPAPCCERDRPRIATSG